MQLQNCDLHAEMMPDWQLQHWFATVSEPEIRARYLIDQLQGGEFPTLTNKCCRCCYSG